MMPYCFRFNQIHAFCLSPCQSPPNFLHAASLAKHVKPVVVIPDEEEPEQQDDDDDDPEPLIEVSDMSTSSVQAQVRHISHRCMRVCSRLGTLAHKYSYISTMMLCKLFKMYYFTLSQQPDIFDQTFGPPNGGFDDR